jgi:hypothetical protein
MSDIKGRAGDAAATDEPNRSDVLRFDHVTATTLLVLYCTEHKHQHDLEKRNRHPLVRKPYKTLSSTRDSP